METALDGIGDLPWLGQKLRDVAAERSRQMENPTSGHRRGRDPHVPVPKQMAEPGLDGAPDTVDHSGVIQIRHSHRDRVRNVHDFGDDASSAPSGSALSRRNGHMNPSHMQTKVTPWAARPHISLKCLMITCVSRRRPLVVALAMMAMATRPHASPAQIARSASPSHVVIPFLANATKPADLDFEGGECELDAAGDRMTCVFQQVFLTVSGVVPDTCLITTNRYERTFRREAPGRWVSTDGPDGVCGLLDVASLEDGGGVRWVMRTRKVVTKPDASPSCRMNDAQGETLSWQNLRRPLPCRFVQPGGLSR